MDPDRYYPVGSMIDDRPADWMMLHASASTLHTKGFTAQSFTDLDIRFQSNHVAVNFTAKLFRIISSASFSGEIIKRESIITVQS